MDTSEREFDLVLYGATSFVGKILCRYLHNRCRAAGDVTWALAGRNQTKLDAVNADQETTLPTIVADATDRSALLAMTRRAKVVCSTVGPYALYGSDLVAACAESGTHYCDLTGETHWIRRMIDAHESTAADTGARIVHTCGFDSIPSDLGVRFTQSRAKDSLGTYCDRIRMGVRAMKGGFSGGTVASMMNIFRESRNDPDVRRILQNPYGICRSEMRTGARQPNVTRPVYDAQLQRWLAPFVMASINTRIVHRTHALAGHPYGSDFLYDESMLMSSWLKASVYSLGLAGFMGMLAVGPTRTLLKKFVLPAPGEGPTPEQQKAGFFDLRFFGRTEDGQTIETRVTGDRDPGYGSTAKMLGETAICLVQDVGDVSGGFPTPATAFGDELIDRLQQHAGLTFERL